MIRTTDSVNASIVMQLVTNISRSKAQMMIHQVREACSIPKPKILFVSTFCDYFGIDLNAK